MKLLLIVLSIAIIGCERPAKQDPAPQEKNPAPAVSTATVVPLPNDVWRGVCYAHSWELGGVKGYGSDASAEALQHLKKQGVDYVSITPFGFMNDVNETAVQGTHNTTFNFGETDNRVRRVTKQAHDVGIRVMLKPHIWIRGGKWRGVIKPIDKETGEVVWDRWWDSHNAWILHYAKLAQEIGAESLVIGLELHTAVQNRPERLKELAGKVREIYDGQITYSANWNEPVPVDVWKTMDLVGVQFYPPLVTGEEEQTDAVMRANLNKHLDHWIDISKRADKPLVITEYGFRSAVGAARFPNAWPDRNPDEKPDDQFQADLYRIFFEEFGKRDSVAGVFLWKYFTNKDTDEEGPNGFSPRGKPAESVIRAFHGTRGAATP